MIRKSRSPGWLPSRCGTSRSPRFRASPPARLLPTLSPPRKVLSQLESLRYRKDTSLAESLAAAVVKHYLLPMIGKNAPGRFSDRSGRVPPTLTEQLASKINSTHRELNEVKIQATNIEKDLHTQSEELLQLRSQLESSRCLLLCLKNQLRPFRIPQEPTSLQHSFGQSRTRAEALARELAEEREQARGCSIKEVQTTVKATVFTLQNTIMGDQIKSLTSSIAFLVNPAHLEQHLQAEVRGIFRSMVHGLDMQHNHPEALYFLTCLNAWTLTNNAIKCDKQQSIASSVQDIKQKTGDWTSFLQKQIDQTQSEVVSKEELVTDLANKVTDINLLHTRDKEVFRQVLIRTRHVDEQQECVVCKHLYLENQNFNWSCNIHLSEWNGTMYWCCGQQSLNHPGCVKTKHTSSEEVEAFRRLNDGSAMCSSCKLQGHLKDKCPLDPNIRSQDELRRALRLKPTKSRRNKPFLSRLRQTAESDDEQDEVEATKQVLSQRTLGRFRVYN